MVLVKLSNKKITLFLKTFYSAFYFIYTFLPDVDQSTLVVGNQFSGYPDYRVQGMGKQGNMVFSGFVTDRNKQDKNITFLANRPICEKVEKLTSMQLQFLHLGFTYASFCWWIMSQWPYKLFDSTKLKAAALLRKNIWQLQPFVGKMVTTIKEVAGEKVVFFPKVDVLN